MKYDILEAMMTGDDFGRCYLDTLEFVPDQPWLTGDFEDIVQEQLSRYDGFFIDQWDAPNQPGGILFLTTSNK